MRTESFITETTGTIFLYFFVFYFNNTITLHTKITYSTYSANIAYDLTILTSYNTNIVYNLISYIRAVATISGFLAYLFVI